MSMDEWKKRCTRALAEDHELILGQLGCLRIVADEAGARGELEEDVALDLLEFFEEFADGLHQDKEEECLFPVLSRRAAPELAEAVGALLRDHRSERRALEGLRRHIRGAVDGDPVGLDSFAYSARRYCMLQREHAEKETRMVLPLAEDVLTDEDDEEIVSGFRRIEARRSTDVPKYMQVADVLRDRFGNPKEPA